MVRGLIHSGCNLIIGLLDDDPLWLVKALAYVLKHGGDLSTLADTR